MLEAEKNAMEILTKRGNFPTPIPTPTAIFYGFFRHEKFTESSQKRNCRNGLDVYDGLKSTSRNSNLSFSANKRTRPVRGGFSFCRGWSVWYPVRRDTPIDGGIALFAPAFEGETPLSRLSSVRKSLLLRQEKLPKSQDFGAFSRFLSAFLKFRKSN